MNYFYFLNLNNWNNFTNGLYEVEHNLNYNSKSINNQYVC